MWIYIVSVYVSEVCGMGKPNLVSRAFSQKRLLVEYGMYGEEARPSLTIDGKLLAADIVLSILEPSTFINHITCMLFVGRSDYGEVVKQLYVAVENFIEVFPLMLIKGNVASWKR